LKIGKIGQSSAAAKYAAATPSDGFSIQEEKPYAEVCGSSNLGTVTAKDFFQLWMGTHPSNPSKDLQTGRTLLDLVQDNQALMSKDISEKYENKLPFLFKILSINKALSIQAHPNKKLAEQLHAKDPKNYPDDNHKPEMTIAITDFEGLCGFRPLNEIAHFLSNVPALRRLVGEDAAKAFESTIQGSDQAASKKALRSAFTKLMSTTKDSLSSATKELLDQASTEGSAFAGSGGPSNTGSELSELVIRLNSQFPSDVGLFVLFFLNYVRLSPGEAMFLRADDIHAYISGDIIECMASSDNVVRAGFTPKFKDVDTLTNTLTYNYAPIEEQKMQAVDYPYVTLNRVAYSNAGDSKLYDPPIEEFAVVRTVLRGNGAKASFDPVQGPSIIICTEGTGKISVGPKSEEVKVCLIFAVKG
jgi:mannose-6-phosphate isomerase